MECSEIFFASQTRRDMETPSFEVKMQSPKEIEEVTNLIASALYRDWTAYNCNSNPLTQNTTIG